MAGERILLGLMEAVVNGQGPWGWVPYTDAGHNLEHRRRPRWRAWVRRCCGQRMFTVYNQFRHPDAAQWPAGSRRARMWYGSKWGWYCETCGLEEQKVYR